MKKLMFRIKININRILTENYKNLVLSFKKNNDNFKREIIRDKNRKT